MGNNNRRKFLSLGFLTGAALLVPISKVEALVPSQEAAKKTLRFLTKEGKLVEVDADQLPQASKAASNDEVKNWIKSEEL
jgi:hypothetical protein